MLFSIANRITKRVDFGSIFVWFLLLLLFSCLCSDTFTLDYSVSVGSNVELVYLRRQP